MNEMILRGIYQVMVDILNELKRMNDNKEKEMDAYEQRKVRSD